MLDYAVGSSSEYGKSLDEISAQPGDNIDGVTLSRLVEVLVISTRNMSQNNRDLEDNMHESRQQIAELNFLLDAVRSESRTDQLTGIPNRKHFDEYIGARIREANQIGDDLSLLSAISTSSRNSTIRGDTRQAIRSSSLSPTPSGPA